MIEFKDYQNYFIAGGTISIVSGILRFLFKINMGSGTILESMGKTFLVVSGTGVVLELVNKNKILQEK